MLTEALLVSGRVPVAPGAFPKAGVGIEVVLESAKADEVEGNIGCDVDEGAAVVEDGSPNAVTAPVPDAVLFAPKTKSPGV